MRAQALVLGEVVVPELGDRALRAVGAVRADGAGEELVRCALDVAADDVLARIVRHAVEGGHHLVGRVEGQGRDARVALAGERRVDTALGGEDDERALGRVADERAIADLGVGAQGHRQQVLLERHVGLAAGVADLADRRVAVAGDGVAAGHGRHLDGGHLVEREGAGLVGVERGRGAERLHRAQALHDRPGVGEHLGALRQDGRGDGREGRGDGRDRERDRAQEQLLQLDVAVQAEHGADHERDAGDDEDLVGQRVQLLGQRGLLVLRDLQHAADVADLGRHPRRRDEDRAGPAGHLAVHERHVHAVPEGGVGGDRVHLLGGGHALARERGLVDLEGRRGQDPRIRGDEVAGLDVHDVARDELLHRDLGELAVPTDLGVDDHHALERRRRSPPPCPPGSWPSRR